MATSLLAIGTTFVGAVGNGPAPSRCTALKDTMPFSAISVNNPHLTDTTAKASADNNIIGNARIQNTEYRIQKTEDRRPKTDCSLSSVLCPLSLVGGSIAIGIDSLCLQRKSQRTQSIPTQLTNNARTTTSKPVISSLTGRPIVADKAPALNEEVVSAKGFMSQKSNQKRMDTASLDSKFEIRNSKFPAKGQKTPILDFSFQQVRGKPFGAEQKAPVGSRKFEFVANGLTAESAKSLVVRESWIVNRATSHEPRSTIMAVSAAKKESSNNRAGNFSQKLNATELVIGVGQTKVRADPTSYNNPNPDFVPMFSSNSTHSPGSQQPSIWTQAINIANPQGQTQLIDVSGNIGEQLIGSIRASLHQTDKYVTISLDPPELGSVLVRLHEQEDKITGLLEVSKAETKYEIEQALPQIIRTLADSGVQIMRLEVQLADQLEPHADRNLAGDGLDDSFQHYHGAFGGNPDENNAGEWLTNMPKNSLEHPQQQMIFTEESINILI